MKNIKKAIRSAGSVLDSILKDNKKVRRGVTLALTFAILMSSQFVPVVYAVSYDGEQVGYVSTKEDAQEIISVVENQASEILGEDFSLENKVSITSVISNKGTAENEQIEKIVLDSVAEIEQLYGIYLDGELVAAVEDDATVKKVIDEIVAEYKEDGTFVKILQSIATKYDYVASSLKVDEAELREMLDPENEDSVHSLKVQKSYMVREETEIPFETIERRDSSMYTDQKKVLVEGVTGVKVSSYYVVEVNGEKVDSTLVSETMAVEVVNEQVITGTKERPSTVSTGNYAWPTKGQISSYFGYRNVSVGSTYHKGIDIWSGYGQEIWAADGGVVTFSGWNNSGYGYLVVITHDNGEETYYAHCSSLAVSEGERVFQGQTIAYMGATGTASGVHLHFEVRVNGQAVDPLTCLS